MTSSEPYTRFLRTFFDAPQRDGPDLRVLDELTPAERESAEELMLGRLVDFPVAMQGVAYLRSAKAVAPLRELMQHKGSVGVRAAEQVGQSSAGSDTVGHGGGGQELWTAWVTG